MAQCSKKYAAMHNFENQSQVTLIKGKTRFSNVQTDALFKTMAEKQSC